MSEFNPALAALLGLVEGLTEFLPVSSTGHLIVLGHWLGFAGGMAPALEMAIQLGSILAIVVYERHRIGSILANAGREFSAFRGSIRASREASDRNMEEGWGYILYRSLNANPNLWFLLGLGVAFMPAAVVGLLTRAWVEAHLSSPVVVAVALIVGGVIILGVEVRPRRPRVTELSRVDLATAFYVGLAQCCALIPGVSRPAATIVSGLLSGMDRRLATEYSFFFGDPRHDSRLILFRVHASRSADERRHAGAGDGAAGVLSRRLVRRGHLSEFSQDPHLAGLCLLPHPAGHGRAADVRLTGMAPARSG